MLRSSTRARCGAAAPQHLAPAAWRARRVGAKQSGVHEEHNGNGTSANKTGFYDSNGNGASTTVHDRNPMHPLANTAEGKAPREGLGGAGGAANQGPGVACECGGGRGGRRAAPAPPLLLPARPLHPAPARCTLHWQPCTGARPP